MKMTFCADIPFYLLAVFGLLSVSCNILDGNSVGAGCYYESGIASWYGSDYQGSLTANGEIYDMESLTAAHKTLPFNTVVRVVNLKNDRTVVVRINNRGPFAEGRVIDLSRKAARQIDIITQGLADIDLYIVGEGDEPVEGFKCPEEQILY